MPRPKHPGKRRPWIRWVLIAFVIFVGYQVMSGPRGILKIRELRAQRDSLQTQIDSLQHRKAELEAEKNRLLTDTTYLERIARKELGMAKPGEKVYRFVTPSAKEGAHEGKN
ncbi:MAG TPA: septum formation initiator family protein [Fibrobacteria bacterium]|jgi:cell division protein FtsB|nr:septum formation initiator family protein [Fibrobacteria bacterium]